MFGVGLGLGLGFNVALFKREREIEREKMEFITPLVDADSVKLLSWEEMDQGFKL
jgi:hypothetical protein